MTSPLLLLRHRSSRGRGNEAMLSATPPSSWEKEEHGHCRPHISSRRKGGKVAMTSALLLLRDHYSRRKRECNHGPCLSHLGEMRSMVIVVPMYLPEGKREGGYDICPSTLGKCRSVPRSLDGNGKGVTIAHGLPLLKGGWADPEK